MNYLKGLSGTSSLGALHPALSEKIKENAGLIDLVLKDAERLSGLGDLEQKVSFDEIVETYNKGISKEEIQAWVWYKRKIGMPMLHWQEYFIDGKIKTKTQEGFIPGTIYNLYPVHIGKVGYPKSILLLDKRAKESGYVWVNDIEKDSETKISTDTIQEFYQEAQSGKAQAVFSDELHNLIKKGVLFYSDGNLYPYPIFTYGNMYEREDRLAQDKEHLIKKYGKEIFENHKNVIEQAKPHKISIKHPDPKERPIILSISNLAEDSGLFSISQIRSEYSDVETAEQLTKVNGKIAIKRKTKTQQLIRLDLDGDNQYSLQSVFIKWLYTLPRQEFKKSNAIDIAEYYVLGRSLHDDKLTNDQKAEIKSNARNEGEALFAKFLYDVLRPEDQERLDGVWNREFNNQSDINYKRVPVGFECSRKFKSGILQLTPIQREGIAFFEAMGSGICAFDVGVGKTMAAIANLASAIYSGQCKRPLIVVPKPTYKKWVGEIIGFNDRATGEFVSGVLSHTGITLNDWGNLGTNFLSKVSLDKKVPEKSITIVTYEGFKRLGFSDKVGEVLLTELINILEQKEDTGSARDKEIDYQKYRAMLGQGQKGTVADIDTLGLDYIVIDEAHRAKNVFDNVKADEEGHKRYSMQSAQSETGIKAFLLCNYIQREYGRNIMLLTATPFTNSPLEIYSMLSLVAYDNMKNSGIYNIRSFFDTFILPTTEYVANYKDEIVEKEVIKSFTNRLILQKIIYNHILYKTGEEAGVKRPCKINLPLLYETREGRSVKLGSGRQVLTYLKPTARQEMNQKAIVSLAQGATAGKLNMADLFRALNYSLDNALSPFIYEKKNPDSYKDFVEGSPKIHYAIECIRTVKDWHELRNEPVSGQVIYMDRGKSFFPLVKEYLEKETGYRKGIIFEGTKYDEVEIITSEISETRKENVKEAFLKGGVKVIIGTSTIREGIDLQKNGTVLHNLYPNWNPTDLRQLEGRIWRQGNRFGYVRVTLPLVQNSMDVFVFQKLEEKTSRINDIWFKADRGNVLAVESLDPHEVKLALISDIDRLASLIMNEEKKELEREEARINNEAKQITLVKDTINSYMEYRAAANEFIDFGYNYIIKLPAASKKPSDIEMAEWKRFKESIKQIEEYQTASSHSDDDILKIGRKLRTMDGSLDINFPYDKLRSVDYFKEAMTDVRKMERTLLKPRGLTIESDLSGLDADVTKETEAFRLKKLHYEDGGRMTEILNDVKEKKQKLAITGKSAGERATEFSKLNYLLAYLADEVDANACYLPSEAEAKEVQQENRETKIMEAQPAEMNELELEALALEVELELLNF